MNFTLPHIPTRSIKPRTTGITMMMDKGLSPRQVEDFIAMNERFTDFVKLGFGTSMVSNFLPEKIALYKAANIRPYLGGTLFEAFVIRGEFDNYIKLLDKFKLDMVEVSDGSITIDHDLKCEYIHKLAKNFLVVSEVGSKEEGFVIRPAKWTSMMKKELDAGSFKVIAEARESGTVGIYRASGHAHTILINKILGSVKPEDILWEAPQKSQQVWFIKLLGPNVNLGNIGYEDVIPLETLRIGLRGDTFFEHLPKELKHSI